MNDFDLISKNSYVHKVLEQYQINQYKPVNEYIHNFQFNVTRDILLDDFIAQINCILYGETIFRKMVTYPLNWKEAFKERWFPKWILKRYPVQYKEIELSIAEVYPNISECPRNERPVCLFLKKEINYQNTED